MRVCPSCKSTVENDRHFCDVCGSSMLNDPENIGTGKVDTVYCPRCGEKHALEPSIVAVGKYSRLYWICRKCKQKFRDSDNLEKEMKAARPLGLAIENAISALVSGVMFFLLSGYLGDKYEKLDYFAQQKYEILQTASVIFFIAGFMSVAILSVLAIKKFMLWKELKREKEDLHNA